MRGDSLATRARLTLRSFARTHGGEFPADTIISLKRVEPLTTDPHATPWNEYCRPILQVLVQMGGRAATYKVIEAATEAMNVRPSDLALIPNKAKASGSGTARRRRWPRGALVGGIGLLEDGHARPDQLVLLRGLALGPISQLAHEGERAHRRRHELAEVLIDVLAPIERDRLEHQCRAAPGNVVGAAAEHVAVLAVLAGLELRALAVAVVAADTLAGTGGGRSFLTLPLFSRLFAGHVPVR